MMNLIKKSLLKSLCIISLLGLSAGMMGCRNNQVKNEAASVEPAKKANGEACTFDNQCASGYCYITDEQGLTGADGVCASP